MKKLSILFLIAFINFSLNAQTAEELKKEQAPLKAEIAKLQGQVKSLQAKIDALPGWRKGAFGTIGGNLSGFNNWYSKSEPNSSAGNIGITVNGFANLIEDSFFWRNSAAVNLGWVKLDDKDDPTDSKSFDAATDVFTITSLYGKKLNSKWAVSGLGEYRTTIIDNFNNPGYLDLGVGFTWTPKSNLVVVLHPGNYNFVFSKDNTVFESSLGAKIVADYTQKYGKLSVKSNLSVFQSYESSNLSNYTFTNSFGYSIWKGIGVGFELGLRKNKQEALEYALIDDSTATFDNVDNKLQSYWLFGLNYAF
ncbi:DUF3078 domain-containing protein [Polaribacter sargassicola]|uniref:DUF3078 domain-containing protein n=1 Tax=Polaribacter sargassicola TaxID=2836891 RepID=UPI001F17E651|nr:DUF3078 domain-containing protein [Polaribacter sp. DS7-9]MCG1037493.1 DUF3078 domain-containing protein [Polaribacter sp. DS7-9]